jgi:hypothetical protein
MREGQLLYSISIWNKNIWFGQGHEYNIFKMANHNDLFGGESIWFTLMMKQGLIGMLAYIILYVDIIYNVRKNIFSKYIISFILGWLVIDSATNLPGINLFLPFMIIIIIYKYGEIISKKEHSLHAPWRT